MPGKRGWSAVFLVAVVVLSSSTVGVVAGQSTVTLTVTVVDENGDPVSNADLSATWDGGGPVNETTAHNGKAFVDVPDGENVTITVDHDDYVRNTPYEVTDASNSDVEITVAEIGTATVDVTDASGPVNRAIVRMLHDGEYVVNGRTDDQGRLTTGDIEQGSYEVRVWKAGYFRNTTSLEVDEDLTAEVAIEEGSRLLRVRVRDDHFSPPRAVTNASVQVSGVGTVSTLSTGDTSLEVPVNTDYDVSVTKDGYVANETTVEMGESEQTANLTIQRTDGINISAANDRMVVGEPVRVTVTDEYGDPVSGASVAIGEDSVGETDDDGEISVPVESAGNQTVTATSGDLEATVVVEGFQPGGGGDSTSGAGNGSGTGPPSGIGGPGFTAVGALVALIAVALLSTRR